MDGRRSLLGLGGNQNSVEGLGWREMNGAVKRAEGQVLEGCKRKGRAIERLMEVKRKVLGWGG